MADKVRIGLIGCGDIAHLRYLRPIGRLETTKLTAVCDLDASRADATAREFGAKARYTNPGELLKDRDVDAVVITTPTPSHAPLVIAAARAGKHVLVEKPLCLSLREADEVIRAVQVAGIVFMPLPYDALPGYRRAKELISRGYIGKLVSIEATATHNGVFHSGWFYRKGSGTLNDMGVYPLSWAVGLFGPAESIAAFTNISVRERTLVNGERVKAEVEDTAAVLLRWPGGQVGTISTNWATAGLGEQLISGQMRGNVIFHGTIYGTEGLMHLDFPDHLVVCSASHRDEQVPEVTYENLRCSLARFPEEQQIDDFSKETWNGPQIVGHFADCIRSGTTPECDMHQQRHVVEVMEKAYRAARTGKVQKLRTSFVPR